jgi:Signal transduction histidine kinase
MKDRSIIFKLFAVTVTFFIILVSIGFILQTAFFQDFYFNRKMRILESSINSFKADYTKMNINQMVERMQEIGEKNNAEVAIISSTDNFSIITSSLQGQSDPGKTQIMQAAINQWSVIAMAYEPQVMKGETITFNIQHPRYNTNNIVKISPILVNGRLDNVIIAVSSLQPVGEAAAVIQEFYIYVYGAAVIFAIILSLIFSNMISKPLINLNKAASRMAELDFTAKCDDRSHDEIGNLAGSLNFLSSKLNTTLYELKSANDKLKSDIEKERSLEKMRKEFVAGVSHELKTPVSLIEGYAEGLKENIGGEEKRDFYIDVIVDEAERMGSLINDMLDLSRLDSGNYTLKPEEFSLNGLTASIVKKYSNNMESKGIDIRLCVEKDDVEVIGDRFRIEQVITNFMSNAIRHTPEGGWISINIRDTKNHAMFEIENQGEHIDEKEMNNIWEKFYRVEKSRNRDTGGTGLGLAISKNILQLHNSDFGARNTDNGVMFYFSLLRVQG